MVIGYLYSGSVLEPLIKNHIYMNQFNNGEYGFILVQSYPYIKFGYFLIMIVLSFCIGIDIYEKYKAYKKEKMNED